jgi:hypothetical protein
MAYSTSSSERCQEKESMPLQAWPRSPNWGHSACQDAAVASTDDFLAVVGTVAYITSGC